MSSDLKQHFQIAAGALQRFSERRITTPVVQMEIMLIEHPLKGANVYSLCRAYDANSEAIKSQTVSIPTRAHGKHVTEVYDLSFNAPDKHPDDWPAVPDPLLFKGLPVTETYRDSIFDGHEDLYYQAGDDKIWPQSMIRLGDQVWFSLETAAEIEAKIAAADTAERKAILEIVQNTLESRDP